MTGRRRIRGEGMMLMERSMAETFQIKNKMAASFVSPQTMWIAMAMMHGK